MAFNIHEEYWDRPLSGNNQDNRIPHGIAVFLSGLFSFLCKVLFRFRVEGKEIVDAFAGKTTGAILVSPHYSYLDVIIMFLSVRPKGWVRLIARDSLFRAGKGFLGMVISSVGAFPIKRGSADRTALKRASRMLKNGEWVGIFPEGTRRGKGSAAPRIARRRSSYCPNGQGPPYPFGLGECEQGEAEGATCALPAYHGAFRYAC